VQCLRRQDRSEELDTVRDPMPYFFEGLEKRLLDFLVRALATGGHAHLDAIISGKREPYAA
jgi:hypothetical protein